MTIVSWIAGAIRAVITSLIDTVFWMFRRRRKSQDDEGRSGGVGNALGILGVCFVAGLLILILVGLLCLVLYYHVWLFFWP